MNLTAAGVGDFHPQNDSEIDQQVYALYGLTPEEIKIVEESTK